MKRSIIARLEVFPAQSNLFMRRKNDAWERRPTQVALHIEIIIFSSFVDYRNWNNPPILRHFLFRKTIANLNTSPHNQ